MVFTFNNTADILAADSAFMGDTRQRIEDLIDNGTIRYIVYGHEVGEAGNHHLQGYVEFATPHTYSAAGGLLGLRGAHWEMRRGTAYQAAEYCKKDGDFLEWGTPPQQTYAEKRRSRATELEDQWTALRAYIDDHPFSTITEMPVGFHRLIRSNMQYVKALTMEAQQRAAAGMRDVRTIVYWGLTGTGKTFNAMQSAGETGELVFIITLNKEKNAWFDGYSGQTTIILDEFDWHKVDINELKRLLDGYPYRLPVKGSFTYAQWTRVFITSNENPKDWYATMPQADYDAVQRRLTEKVEFTVPFHRVE